MTGDSILTETRDRVLHVMLNRPEKRNALTESMRIELTEIVRQAARDRDVGAILIKGAGKSFCAGVDISPNGARSSERSSQTLPERMQSQRELSGRWGLLWDSPKPVLAQVHGHCIGGGTDLALHCDIVIAAEDAQFGYPPVRAQSSPGTHMWTYLVGPQWAKRLLLTGDLIDGKTAAQIGLVLKAVPSERLDGEAVELARRIAMVPSDLLAINKGICNRALELMGRGLLQQLAADADALGSTVPSAAEFARIASENGFRAALEWRDGKFRDGANPMTSG